VAKSVKENNNHSLKNNGWASQKEAIRLARSKIVLNTENGIFYNSCKSAALAHGINYSTLISQLNGGNRNRTSLIYV